LTVIEKILGQLQGAEKDSLIEQIKPLLSQLKKYSYGKQIVAIEKLIFDPNMPSSGPLSHIMSSTTPPNSHKSSPQPSKRSMENGQVAVGAAPPTPPPNETQAAGNGSTEAKGLAKSTVASASGSTTPDASVAVEINSAN
jgi:mRNA-binding protein PUF3